MAESREDTISAVYRCINADRLRDLDRLIPAAAVLVQDPAFPDAREWHGADGVRQWFSQITAQFGAVRVEPIEMLASDGSVLAVVEVSVKGRTSGAGVSQPMAHLWTFRGEAIAGCQFYLDVEQARARFGSG